MLSILLNFAYLIFTRRQLLNKAVELDDDAYTPSDYALIGYNMRFKDYAPGYIEDHLKKYFL